MCLDGIVGYSWMVLCDFSTGSIGWTFFGMFFCQEQMVSVGGGFAAKDRLRECLEVNK